MILRSLALTLSIALVVRITRRIAGGGKQANPELEQELGQASFFGGGHVRQAGVAAAAGHGVGFELAGLHMAHDRRRVVMKTCT